MKVDETGIDIDLAFRKEVPIHSLPDVDIKAHWQHCESSARRAEPPRE